MSNLDEQLREIDRLRDRMSRLSAASPRINTSLDLDTPSAKSSNALAC